MSGIHSMKKALSRMLPDSHKDKAQAQAHDLAESIGAVRLNEWAEQQQPPEQQPAASGPSPWSPFPQALPKPAPAPRPRWVAPSSVTLFASPQEDTHPARVAAAEALAQHVVDIGARLVHPAYPTGLGAVVARRVRDLGGNTLGVMVGTQHARAVLAERGERAVRLKLSDQDNSDLVAAPTAEDANDALISNGKGCIVLPGGFDVLDSVACARKRHPAKKVVFLNTEGFYDDISAFHDNMLAERFNGGEPQAFVKTPKEALLHLYRQVMPWMAPLDRAAKKP